MIKARYIGVDNELLQSGSKLRTDCYVNDSTGVLQQVVSSLLCTYKIMIRWVPKHMKDTGDLFSKICDMNNLRKAHKKERPSKQKKNILQKMIRWLKSCKDKVDRNR